MKIWKENPELEKKKEYYHTMYASHLEYYNNNLMYLLKKIKGKKWVAKEFPKRAKYLKNEVPVMVTRMGHLVTIPFTKDPFSIGICGQKGTGKSLLMNSLAGRIYWLSSRFRPNLRCGILNDIQDETGSWYQRNKKFKTHTLHLLREKPVPIPIIKLYPSFNMQMIPERQDNDPPQIKICIPFKTFTQNPRMLISPKILGGSQKYWSRLSKEFIDCKTLEECEDIIEDSKLQKSIKNKIYSLLYDIWQEKIFDINNPDAHAFAQIKFKETNLTFVSNPFLAFMVAGAIPSVQSRSLKNKFFSEDYFDYLLREVFEKQINNDILKKGQYEFLIFVDELNEISEKNKTKDLIQKLLVEGRMLRLGLIWASQNPSMIAKRICRNTKYMFVFRSPRTEVSAVADVFNLDDRFRNAISRFDSFECLLATSEKVIVYDFNNNKRFITREPQVGKILFPLSQSRPPT